MFYVTLNFVFNCILDEKWKKNQSSKFTIFGLFYVKSGNSYMIMLGIFLKGIFLDFIIKKTYQNQVNNKLSTSRVIISQIKLFRVNDLCVKNSKGSVN